MPKRGRAKSTQQPQQQRKIHPVPLLAGALVFIIIVGAIVRVLIGGSAMQTVQEGDTVVVHYEGRLETGEVFDSSRDRDPLTFTIGKGQVIPGFEAGVLNMKVGEKKTITIKSEEAYGQRRNELVQELPIDKIPPEGRKVGGILYFNSQETGTLPVTVTEVKDTTVLVDMNHPLAGKTLIFDIELVEIVN